MARSDVTLDSGTLNHHGDQMALIDWKNADLRNRSARFIAIAALVCHAIAMNTIAQQTYVLVALGPEASIEDYTVLPSFDPHAISQRGDSIEIIITEEDANLLHSRKMAPRIVISDMAEFYAQRASSELGSGAAKSVSLPTDDEPANFRLGSAGGAYTLEEYRTILDSMLLLYPELISKRVIGKSVEGRDITLFSVSAPGEGVSRRRALLTGLHHAREPVSGTNVIYTMWALLEGYGNDIEITSLLDHRRVDCVPVVNPDGYQKNLSEYPQGGGLWRKNLGANGDGVDLNRNYGPPENWNGINDGPNDSPTDNNYRGVAPYSEPETQAMRDLMTSERYSTVLHHHSYGELLLHDHQDHYELNTRGEWPLRAASDIASPRGLGYGLSSIAIGYRASGTATEWATHNPDLDTYAWTPETGDQIDGFWPLPSRYRLLCRESLDLNLRAIRAAGPSIAIEKAVVDNEGYSLVLRNVGTHAMNDTGMLMLDGWDPLSFRPLQVNESLDLRLDPNQPTTSMLMSRTETSFTTIVDGVHERRTFSPIAGKRTILFEDDFERPLSTSWIADLWGVESLSERGRVLTDSPYEPTFFSPFANVIELRDPIDLAGFEAAELSFDTRGVLDARNHALRVVIVGDDIVGEGSVQGSESMQIDNAPPDRGITQSERPRTTLRGEFDFWHRVSCNLDRFVGKRVRVRFVLETRDRSSVEVSRGVYIDNLRIEGATRRPSDVTLSQPREYKNQTDRVQIFRGSGKSIAEGIRRMNQIFRDTPAGVNVSDVLGRSLSVSIPIDSLVEVLRTLDPGVYIFSGDQSIIVTLL